MSDPGGPNFAELADGILRRARARLASGLRDVEAVGEAADGRVRAVVAPVGRLRDLTIDPQLIRSRDPESLVESIKAAINRAADELQAKPRLLLGDVRVAGARRTMIVETFPSSRAEKSPRS